MKLIQKRLRTCSFARRGSPSASVGLGQMLPLRWKTYRAAEDNRSSILRISADTAWQQKDWPGFSSSSRKKLEGLPA